jgi:dTDP-4-dehydrorhamnose 3,5-epimerase
VALPVLESGALPDGVRLLPLTAHADARGTFTEVFRNEWGSGVEPVQWNLVASGPRVLRGVHVHQVHADYLLLAAGEARVGLHDLRGGSPTEGVSALLRLPASAPAALVIPPGVAHGFYFPVPSLHLYAVSHYWSTADELGCLFSDPELQIPWPDPDPVLSARDAALPALAALRAQLAAPAAAFA